MAGVDVYRAEAEVATRKQDLALVPADHRSAGDDNLKNCMSREGLEDPARSRMRIVVRWTALEVPATDDLPPLRELVAAAMTNRPDMIACGKINDRTQAISSAGTKNGILPFLPATDRTRNEPKRASSIRKRRAPPIRRGRTRERGRADVQARLHHPVGPSHFSGSFGNHPAQADYGIDQLQLRPG